MRKLVLLFLVLLTTPIHAATSEWNASSGILPNAACPGWELVTIGSSVPSFGGGRLVIQTSAADFTQRVAFRQTGAQLDFSQPVVIEARMRFVSGSAAAPHRTPAEISFVMSGSFGNTLFIDQDRLFLEAANNVIGPTAFVDTDGAFHTYRIEIDRSGYVRVSQDGHPVLEGPSFESEIAHGVGARIVFGEDSNYAGGRSEWEWVRHSALVEAQAPCLRPAVSDWYASSGQLPDEICVPWQRIQQGSPAAPLLSGGKLLLATSESDFSQWSGYTQREPLISFARPVVIEARMRYVSGVASVPYRSAAHIVFTLAGSLGNGLFIAKDRLFLEAADGVLGAQAAVDTDDRFHDYRLEVSPAGDIRVLHDGVQVLTGSSFGSPAGHGTGPRIFFGEGTYGAGGSSEWQYIRHNAFATRPVCPNRPPVAAAGADQFLECAGATTTVTLDGRASIDLDGDALTYEWMEGSALLGTGPLLATSLASGGHAITLRVTDPSSASSQDNVYVQIADTLPPTIAAPLDVRASNGGGAACAATIAEETLGSADAMDACSAVQVSRSGVPPGNVFPVGTTTITYTATDASGNVATATQRVTVTDETAPSIVAPPDVSATSCTVAESDLGTAAASDACSTVQVTRSVPSGNAFPVGTTIVTYTARDAYGNLATATQRVTVTDTTPPSIAAPRDVTVSTGTSLCAANVADALLGSATAADACSAVQVARTGVPAGNLFLLGTTLLTYTATDASGNIATATQRITVIDRTPPSLVAPPDVIVSTRAQANACSAFVADSLLGIASASDACGATRVTRSGVPAGNLFPVGTTTLTYTASDANGNLATATQRVTVIDATSPSISLVRIDVPRIDKKRPGVIDVDVFVAYDATDNCGIASMELEVSTSVAPSTGPETWQVLDAHTIRFRIDNSVPGNEDRLFFITVVVTDIHGNRATTKRTVNLMR